jgi:hypothetical protein
MTPDARAKNAAMASGSGGQQAGQVSLTSLHNLLRNSNQI